MVAAAAGVKPPKRSTEENLDPNGLEVRSVASGPGDYFCRVCLRSSGGDTSGVDALRRTEEFYTQALGMKTLAEDDDMVCLRCPKGGDYGASITLVFERGNSDVPLEHGNCFDHMVISTKDVDEAAAVLRTKLPDDAIFMEPQDMFGSRIMGLKDPNGYKVYLAELDNNNEGD